MRRFVQAILVVGLVAVLGGCAAQDSGAAAPAEATAQAAIPPDSPLAKIKVGMRMQEVIKILGAPTDQNSYSTGKAWIPFYYGDDVRRTAYYYKGLGRVIFNGGNVFGGGGGDVIRVDYDPSESGMAR
jgi:outer membrane protein assembly factor BamE (lipoprotein component of BamABCDE complex)